jgi:ABC-2 type transport system permease protein
MRNVWLITKREYMTKVRTRSFIIATLAMPLIIGIFILPGRLATMKMGGTSHIVVVSADRGLAEKVQQELQKQQPTASSDSKEDDTEGSARELTGKYVVEISTDLSDAERNRLRDRASRKEIDGYLWLGPEQLASRKITYGRRETGDFMDQSAVRSAMRSALVAQALSRQGMSVDESADVLKDVKLDIVQIARGQEKKVNAGAAFAATFALVLLLYTTVLFYGVAVMRAVVEEKSSRVLEVLLSSVTPKQLMAGKVVGVGAVGLTQIAIWSALAAVLAAPGALAADLFRKAQISPWTVVAFAVFFLLGYALYATMYAALGAVVNTEQEGQQMQIIIMLPLILAISFVMIVMRDPNGTLATWVSMIPFVAPVVMYLRIVVQTPPLWQVLLSIGILVATIYGLVVLCSRIYRIGILMYGKRPTLPEIIKWIKYAGA